MTPLIRLADSADLSAKRDLVADAFLPEDVATFIDALRLDTCILEPPKGDRVDAAMLTPLAVRPDRQRRGIGLRLIAHSLHALEARGERLFFVLGHPEYYPRAGFRAEAAAKVANPWFGNPAFMARADFMPEGTLILPAVIAAAH